MCSGEAFVGDAGEHATVLRQRRTGLREQFRHQYFLVFLIAHLHKAALLMLSDRLVDALNRLDVRNADSVSASSATIRSRMEMFLRFTHRYWFHDVTNRIRRTTCSTCAAAISISTGSTRTSAKRCRR